MIIEIQLNCTGPWQSFGDDIDLKNFNIEKSLNGDDEQQKDISAGIIATGSAYNYFKQHLIDSSNRYSNTFCARVTFTECSNEVFLFTIENNDLEYCQGGICEIKFDLKEQNELRDCLDNTLVADNHLGWFNNTPGAFIYPRFRYCDVTRPYLLLVAMLSIAFVLDLVINIINIIISVINAIISAVNTLPGVNINKISAIPTISQLLLSCDRSHPAPFIRTYTDNVCSKCGVTTNAVTNPIFYNVASRYYYLTLLTAYVRKGYHYTNTKRYIPDNAPLCTLRKLYKELGLVFNSRYFLKDSTFYFDRRDQIGNTLWGGGYAIDLTNPDHAEKVIDKVCFNYNGKSKISRLYCEYAADGTDKEGDRARRRFNGEGTDFSSPNYKRFKEKVMLEFGAQLYSYDGIDSVYDSAIRDYTIGNGYQDYMGILKLSSDIARLGKLIVWDPASGMQNGEAIGQPYNSFNTSEWSDDDGPVFYPPPSLGGLISAGLVPNDFQVKNYPMFFSPLQNAIYPNLWEFHAIDMPTPGSKENISFNFKLNYCCEFLSLDMYQKVLLNANDEGEINYVKIDKKNFLIEVRGNLIN